jgi:hypothetical protein
MSNTPAARYEVWICDPAGARIANVARYLRGLTIVRTANDYGSIKLDLTGDIDETLLRLDGIVEVWRTPPGGSPKLYTGFMRDFDDAEDEDGQGFISVIAPDANYLLDGRIVAYAAGSAYSRKTDYADDMMKAVVRENLGASVGIAARRFSNLTVQADASLGPSIAKGFAWRNVLLVLQDLQEASRAASDEVHFDIAPVASASGMAYQFRTYAGQLGQDLTDLAVFGAEWGNLRAPRLSRAHAAEKNYIYAGGGGQGRDRTIVQVTDTVRAGASPWARRERFADGRAETTAGLTSRGRQALDENRPRGRFEAELLDTPQAPFGLAWDFGDKVSAIFRGQVYTGMVRAVKINLYSDGAEQINAKMDTDL